MGRFTGKKCRLMSMLWLTGSFFFIELVVGYVTNSMALVADSFHMLSDVAALIVAFLSVKMSPKKWSKNTFGWARAEVLGALVNAVFLVALCFSITVEACKRFIDVEEIQEPVLLVVVGSLGLFLNIIGLFLFHEHGSSHGHSHGGHAAVTNTPTAARRLSQLVTTNSMMMVGGTNDGDESDEMCPPGSKAAPNDKHEHSHNSATSPPPRVHGHSHDPGHLNMRGVFLHVLSDALGSVIVVCSALVVWLTEWQYRYYLDPALSIVLVLLILHSVWPLLRESALILLQTVPTHIQVDAIQRRLLEKVDGVLAVHEFHVWQLAGDRIIASAHIRCRNLSEYMKLAEKVKEFFHNEGIHSTTIQPEFVELPINGTEVNGISSVAEPPCALHCPTSDTCHKSTCCGPNHQGQSQGRSSPSPVATPYLCRQRSAASLAEGGAARLDALESGSLLPPDVRRSTNLV